MSERFEDHVGVAHILARQGFARAQSMGSGLEYMDIFQEVGLVFSYAADKFDPKQGFKFSTFLTRCVYNHFNNTLFKKEGRHISMGMSSIEEVMERSEEPEDFFDRHDCGRCDSPEDILEFRQHIAGVRSGFSSLAQRMLLIIEQPPAELLEEVRRVNWHRVNHLGEESQDDLMGLAEVGELLALAGVERGQIQKAKAELLRFARKL